MDTSKRLLEAQLQLKDSSTLYEVVKNERNKYVSLKLLANKQVNQIQSTSQKAAEMKEKIRILSNEIEILNQELVDRDKELTVFNY